MNLAILSPAVFPSMEIALHKLRFFLLSCERFGINPHLYGIGTKQFPGYRRMKIELPLIHLATLSHYSHILYTDSWDVLFTGPLEEIQSKYERMGSPPLLQSAFYQLGNVSNEAERYPGCFDPSIHYRYPNCGGFMGELDCIRAGLERMKDSYPQYGDDCFMHYDAWKEGWWRPILDSNCDIFQVRSEENTVMAGHRIHNQLTGSFPCILHLSGGYASQTTGRDADMQPWAERLGLIG